MYNFGEIKSHAAFLVQRAGDADYLSSLGTFINHAHSQAAKDYDYFNALEDIFNFSSTASTEDYYLPNNFDLPFTLLDLTNKKEIPIIPEDEYVHANISNIANSTTGTPHQGRIFSAIGVRRQPGSSGSVVRVKSSSASDTVGAVVRVEGYIDSSKTILDFENIIVSRATPTTNVSGSKTFYKITHVSKSIDTTGYITVTDSSDNTLAILTSIDRVLTHKILKLGLIPSATISYRLYYKKRVNKLVSDYDYPFTEMDDYLAYYAAGMATVQSKETTFSSEFFVKKAEECKQRIIQNESNKLGPNFQKKFTNIFAQAHRG